MSQQLVDQQGHQYGNIVISNDGRAQIGDTIIQHYYAPQLRQNKNEALVNSLKFERMDARLLNVAAALPATCEWLVHHGKFVAWAKVIDPLNHQCFLWIKGKPGCGKSTIMKETLAWAKRNWAPEVFLSYFFNARSPHSLEKSRLGLYRSLLHQFLSIRPHCCAPFVTRFASKEKNGAVEEWTEIELQNFFLELAATGELSSVNIFIDALDEGDDNDIRKLVAFLRQVIRLSTSDATTPCKICLSSRHYPYVNIPNALSIVLEDESGHNQDIESYVEDELVGEDDTSRTYLRQRICQRSAGVFLWVVLVTSMLNKMYDEGEGTSTMLKKLEEVPIDLHQIFSDILSSTSEGVDKCESLLRWVLFSTRPLLPYELYCAIKLSCPSKNMDGLQHFSRERLNRYLLSCSRGLVELTKDNPPVMQFIHETVRDYLLSQSLSVKKSPEHYGTGPFLKGVQVDECNLMLAENCLTYLLGLVKEEVAVEEISKQHPFVGYAARYWHHHAKRSKIHSRQFLNLALQLLMDAEVNLLKWVQLYDIYDDALKVPMATRQVYLDPALHYAAYIGIPALVSEILPLPSNVNEWGRTYGSALLAATVRSHEEVVSILLSAGADVNIQGRIKETILYIASERGNHKIVQMLVNAGASVNVTNAGPLGTALRAASRWGYEKIVKILIEAKADVDAQTWAGNSLQIAAAKGHSSIVQILVDAGANVNNGGLFYKTPLASASEQGHTDIVQMLVKAGADIDADWGGPEGSALKCALLVGHEKVVNILIDAGADVNAIRRKQHYDPKQLASSGAYSEVVKKLTSVGAKPTNSSTLSWRSNLPAVLNQDEAIDQGTT